MAKVEEKAKFCQSKFYKDWNPDTLAKYNRLIKNKMMKKTKENERKGKREGNMKRESKIEN